jgi:hypothetical protein
MAAFQNHNFLPGSREIRGGGEAIVTSAYNDSVVLCMGSCHIAFAPGRRLNRWILTGEQGFR